MKHFGSRSRLVLSSLVVLLPASGLVSLSSCAEGTRASGACGDDQSECDGACVDTTVNPAHCGACGKACSDGQTCEASSCLSGGDGGSAPGCDDGETNCGGTCADLQTDTGHCGRCESPCAPGQVCEGGMCQRGACGAGLTGCGDACVNTVTDPSHCGGCDRACGQGRVCQDGGCACGDIVAEAIDGLVPQTVTGTTAGGIAGYGLSCIDASSSQRIFQFTPPASGTYFFDTFGSTFDAAVGVLSAGRCEEAACRDDDQGTQAKAELDLLEGEPVLVVVTGSGGVEGEFRLNITQPGAPICSPTALGTALPQTIPGNPTGVFDTVVLSCGTSGADTFYSFTAPEDADYVFETSGVSRPTAIEVLDGTCSGASLACEAGVDFGPEARVVVPLAAAQTAIVVVESDVSYTLDVSQLPVLTCPSRDLGSTLPRSESGNNDGLANRMTPACSSFSRGEVTYSFTALTAGLYQFDTEGSASDTIIDVLDGTCGGPSLGCNDNTVDDTSRVIVPLRASQTVIVNVDSYIAGGYTLHIADRGALPGTCTTSVDLGNTVPQTITRSTAALADTLAPADDGCTTSSGPEYFFRFTAPAAGSYTIATQASTFDTVLYVRDGSCAGAELACNDDAFPATGSRVTVTLASGQTIFIVVDGALPEEYGDFTLNISSN